ncbi:MAG: MATE family efflux transporter [Polyangiaceae bacterium]
MGAPLTLLVYFGASTLFPLLVDQQPVVEVGVGYWQMRALSIVAVGINFSFRGFWNGVGESWRYFVTLLVMHLCNVVISYALIFGVWGMPEMGADGAGLGSSIATYVGTLVAI